METLASTVLCYNENQQYNRKKREYSKLRAKEKKLKENKDKLKMNAVMLNSIQERKKLMDSTITNY